MSYFDDNEDDIIYYRPSRIRTVECNRCGKGGFSWEETDDGWVLVDQHYEVHRCPKLRAREDDFTAL